MARMPKEYEWPTFEDDLHDAGEKVRRAAWSDEWAREADRCPVCGSKSIEGGSPEFMGSGRAAFVTVECMCAECDAGWTETYALVARDGRDGGHCEF